LAPHRRSQRVRDALDRRRGAARGALLWVEGAAAIATVTAVGIGLVNHFTTHPSQQFPGEGKRVVAFRQLANRICTENLGNMHRALTEGQSRVDRLGFVARGIGWDLNDLESITPPPSRFGAFLSEIAVRRRVRPEVFALQRAVELGDRGGEASAITALEASEAESRELARQAGLVRCMRILPSITELMRA
jgi:hypothetical protein